MIGKIMSEASHSIIGMLSAKPSDMETRTANNEFSSLLLPGEDRPAGASDNGGADMAEDKSGAQFLNQLAPPTNDQAVAKAVTLKISVDGSEADTGQPSDTQSAPVSLSEMEQFIAAMQPSPRDAASASASQDAQSNETSSTTGQQRPSIAASDLGLFDRPTFNRPPVDNPLANGKPSLPTEAPASDLDVTAKVDGDQKTVPLADSPKASVFGDKRSPILTNLPGSFELNAAPDEIAPKANGANPSIAAKPHSDLPQTDAGPINLAKDMSLNGKAPVAPLVPQGVASGQTIKSPLDLRLANPGKAEMAGSRPMAGRALDEADIAIDKPIKIEGKLSPADAESRSVASHLERNIELPVQAQNTGAVAGQNVQQKTVSFDWNAPQFAERFAAEVSDLRINGDLKKFEINPRNMGRLEVSLISRAGSEIIQIEAETDAARDVIVQNSQAIQDMLKAQGRSDLTVRVDVRENSFAASQNGNMDFSQQDGAGEREEGATPSQHSRAAAPIESDSEPQLPTDNSRYA